MSYNIEDIITNAGLTVKLLKFELTGLSAIDDSMLTEVERRRIAGFKSIKRKLEFYYTRLLWKSFGYSEPIRYTETGKPVVSAGHISISHSGNVIVIGLNREGGFGIDVEYISDKLKAVQHKFISPADEALIDSRDINHLAIAWSIKEAVYKMEDIPELSFRDHIHVRIDGSKGYTEVIKDGEAHHYVFESMIRDHYVIAWCRCQDLQPKEK